MRLPYSLGLGLICLSYGCGTPKNYYDGVSSSGYRETTERIRNELMTQRSTTITSEELSKVEIKNPLERSLLEENVRKTEQELTNSAFEK